MMREKKTMMYIDRLSGLLPYLGLIIVGALVIQGRSANQIADKALRESVAQQEVLRSVLWTNLLAQRVGILSLTSVVTDDESFAQKAKTMSSLLSSFLPAPEMRTATQNTLMEKMDEVEKLLDVFINEPRHLRAIPFAKEDPALRLIDDIDRLGTSLNASESQEWYQLVDKNNLLLNDLRTRHNHVNLSYGVFVFYLLALGWVSYRKKQTELYLKQSERKMRVLAEASFEGLIIVAEGIIIEVNPAFEALFEVTGANIIGHPVLEFLALPPGYDHEARVEAVGHRSISGDISVEVSVKGSMVENQPIEIIAVRDLTDKKQTDSLRLQKEAAEQANRAKSVFLANMSHELRTPMHGILSFSRFGMQGAKAEANETLGSHFQEIFESGSRLMQLLDDLLDLAKLEAGKMSYAMGPADFVEQCERIFLEQEAFAKERHLNFALVKPSAEMIVVMDSTRIGQVLRNLLTNAIKFSDPKTTITVEVAEKDQWLECKISNKGKGIPSSELLTIFDKFVQSSKTRTGAGGTGLGLAICREIIVSHQGQIWAESESTGWTHFIFKFPMEGLT
jgi:signal transduction histidine kinase